MKNFFVSILLSLGLAQSVTAAPQCVGRPGNFWDGVGSALYAGGAAKISATYCGGEAGYFNTVYFWGNGEGRKFIGSGNSASGQQVNLSVSKQGDELIFDIDVVENGGATHRYTTGRTAADGVKHASVIGLGNGQYWIGFEDIWGGGDFDYDDAQIVVEVATVGVICNCDADWKNHGEYVKCVTHATNEFVKLGVLSGSEKGKLVSEAGRSQCGK